MTFQPGPYDPNTPEMATDSLATSQSEIQNNFQQLFNIFAKNHISLDALTSAGNHNVIQLKQQGDSQQTDVSTINIYTKNDEGTTDQIFLKYQDNITEFQLSCYQIYGLTQFPGTSEQYITFLPGRILVYFGSVDPVQFKNSIELYPPIAKNIMSVDLCPKTINPATLSFKPWISLEKSEAGFFTKIALKPAIAQGVNPVFYIVLANI